MELHQILGHLSFGLTAASWMMRSVMWLRIMAIVATILGICFNYLLPSGPLWQVIGWLTLFVVINIVQVITMIREMAEEPLLNREKAILVAAWPQMHSRDFKCLMGVGTLLNLPAAETILVVGDGTDSLWLVIDGWLEEHRDDDTQYRLGTGSTSGGATFIARDDLGGSPSNVIAGARGVTIMKWRYETLFSLVAKRPRMGPALYEGITRAMIVKYRMLREHEAAPLASYSEPRGLLNGCRLENTPINQPTVQAA
jgi:CRP-like cAMP-binding protein